MKVHVLNKQTTEMIESFPTVKAFERYVSILAGYDIKGFYNSANFYNSTKRLCVPHKLVDYAKDRLRANKCRK